MADKVPVTRDMLEVGLQAVYSEAVRSTPPDMLDLLRQIDDASEPLSPLRMSLIDQTPEDASLDIMLRKGQPNRR